MRAPRIMSARLRDAVLAEFELVADQLIRSIGVAVFGIVGISGSLDFVEGVLDFVDERRPESVGVSIAGRTSPSGSL